MCVFFFFVFFWLECLYTITACNILNELLFLYLHYSAFSFRLCFSNFVRYFWHYYYYCDVFISCLDYHSDGTHSLQRMHCYIYPNLMKKQTPLIQASLYDSFEAAFTPNKPIMTSHGYALQASLQSEKWTDLARALPWASRSTVGTPRRTKRVKSDCSMFEYFWKAMFLMTGGNWWWSPIIIQRLSRL